MTHKERMLATIMGKPTDKLPWAPRMDLWYIAQRARNTLPAQLVNKNMVEMAQILDVACHAVGADFTIPQGRDISLRGLGLDNHSDYPYRIELQNLPTKSDDDGKNLITEIQTPVGNIQSHLYRTEQMQKDGISLPFVKHYPLHNLDDLEALCIVFDHIALHPMRQSYIQFKDRVGEQGIAVARGPMAASPMHLILHELTPMDQFFYFYHDARDKLKELCDHMTPFFDAALDALVHCDAEVVFWGANYDQDLTWPPFFDTEIKPWLQKVADRLHSAGKILLTHCDGENRDLLPHYTQCRFDIAESVCPAPMTQCSLQELRTALPNTTIWGGIPSIALLSSTMTDGEFDNYLNHVFANLDRGDHLILGVADNVPPDADLTRLEQIRDHIENFGPTDPTQKVK
ncbi:MAG: hypothetical protein HOH77_00080 [Candidatus Latescibacteria bacterium]|nr:hypothetical protein [Candidatus Latescibacterota bacterium]